MFVKDSRVAPTMIIESFAIMFEKGTSTSNIYFNGILIVPNVCSC